MESKYLTTDAFPPRTARCVRWIPWIAAAVFLVFLGVRDLQLDRTLDVAADTRRNHATPYLSAFGPPSRVDVSSSDTVIVGEPVYVNLRIPRWFRRATLTLRYQNPDELPFRLGVRTHPTEWAFHFPDPIDCPTLSVGQSCRRVPFELSRAWQVERNVYRFVLSVPGVDPEHPIIVHALRVTAERDPMCIGRFCL